VKRFTKLVHNRPWIFSEEKVDRLINMRFNIFGILSWLNDYKASIQCADFTRMKINLSYDSDIPNDGDIKYHKLSEDSK